MFRLFTLLTALLTVTSVFAQETYDDFDDRRQLDYGFIHGEFFAYAENPDVSGSNTSPNCAKYFRNPVEIFDVIVTNPGTMADISDYLSGTKSITLDVYAPAAGITVQITLEDSVTALATNYPTGRRAEFTATTTVANDWETLTFNLVNEPDATVPNTGVNRLVLLFNPGTAVNQEWYLDNLNAPERVTIPCETPVDVPELFWDGECEQDISFGFKHGVLARKPNPDTGGPNTSAYALRYDRNVGELDDVILGDFPVALDMDANSTISFDVYDKNAPSVYVLSLQTSAGVDVAALLDSTDASELNTWATMTYDLSGLAGAMDVSKFVLLYKPGNFLVGRTFIDNWSYVPAADMPDGLFEPAALENLTLFPNPASTEVLIDLTDLQLNSGEVTVFDLHGRAVLQPQNVTSSRIRLDVSELATGTYVARVTGEEGVFSRRFNVIR